MLENKKLNLGTSRSNLNKNIDRDGNQGQRDPEKDGGTPKIMQEAKITLCITRPNWSRSEGSRDRYFQTVKPDVHLMHLELS